MAGGVREEIPRTAAPVRDIRAPEDASLELKTEGCVTVPALKLTSYTVMPGRISIHLRGEIPRQEIGELLDRIARLTRGKFLVRGEIGGIAGRFSVASVTSRRGTAIIVLYAPADAHLVRDLLPLAGTNNVTLVLGIPGQVPDLRGLLERVARAAGENPPDLLERLTTFVGKDGRTVPGRRDPSQLSERQAQVVRDRLLRMQRQMDAERRIR